MQEILSIREVLFMDSSQRSLVLVNALVLVEAYFIDKDNLMY